MGMVDLPWLWLERQMYQTSPLSYEDAPCLHSDEGGQINNKEMTDQHAHSSPPSPMAHQLTDIGLLPSPL